MTVEGLIFSFIIASVGVFAHLLSWQLQLPIVDRAFKKSQAESWELFKAGHFGKTRRVQAGYWFAAILAGIFGAAGWWQNMYRPVATFLFVLALIVFGWALADFVLTALVKDETALRIVAVPAKNTAFGFVALLFAVLLALGLPLVTFAIVFALVAISYLLFTNRHQPLLIPLPGFMVDDEEEAPAEDEVVVEGAATDEEEDWLSRLADWETEEPVLESPITGWRRINEEDSEEDEEVTDWMNEIRPFPVDSEDPDEHLARVLQALEVVSPEEPVPTTLEDFFTPQNGAANGYVNLNEASVDALLELTHVGRATAAKIEAYRKRKPFEVISDLYLVGAQPYWVKQILQANASKLTV
jgi:hypothetical protein